MADVLVKGTASPHRVPSPQASPSSQRRLPNFDILRLGLAAEVALRHAMHVAAPALWMPYPILPVPAFLGISGYLVLQSLQQRGIADFWNRRFRRITPALLTSVGLAGALFGVAGVAGPIATYLSAGLGSGRYNGALWSLLPEEFAYSSMCLLWLAGAYRSKWALWFLLGASLLLTWAMYRMQSGYNQNTQIVQLAPAFFAGNLLYVYRERVPHVGAPILLFTVWANMAWVTEPLWMALSGAVGAVGCVMVGTQQRQARWWKMPDLSYGVYVYHLPLLHAIGIAGLPLTVVASVVSWYTIESPVIRREAHGLWALARWVARCAAQRSPGPAGASQRGTIPWAPGSARRLVP